MTDARNEGADVLNIAQPIKKVGGFCPKCNNEVYMSIPNEPKVDFKYARLKWTEERAETLRDETLHCIDRIQAICVIPKDLNEKINQIKTQLVLLREEQCR